jgi:hypothetical protein
LCNDFSEYRNNRKEDIMGAAVLRMAASSARPAEAVGDLRFRRLLGAAAWDRLPAAVQARFAKRLGPGAAVTYRGRIESCTMSLAGWLLAQACRVIGAPLPLDRAGGMAAIVTVTEDGDSGGQVWSRLYARPHGFPQVIHSAKRFSGPTGIEEYLGGGFGIALTVHALPAGIRFASDQYFLQLAGRRWRLPRWLGPGQLHIDHEDRGYGSFSFTLTLRHPLFGLLMHQHSVFADQANSEGAAR